MLLTDVARAAGEVALGYWKRSPRVWEKDAGAGPVTEADLAVNRLMEQSLREARPDYGWLSENQLDPQMIRRKMETLGFPYTAAEIKAIEGKNEMDAIVAYMQKLGSDIPWRDSTKTEIVGDLVNPYAGVEHGTMEPWEELYQQNCAACHASGVMGAPKFGDKAAWSALSAEGVDNLAHNAINGEGRMPPKGGNPSITDAQAEAAMEYMLAGATAVQIGTASFLSPLALPRAIDGLEAYCSRKGIGRAAELVGGLQMAGQRLLPGRGDS